MASLWHTWIASISTWTLGLTLSKIIVTWTPVLQYHGGWADDQPRRIHSDKWPGSIHHLEYSPPGQDGAGPRDFVTLLRMARNLKLMSCLFLELSMYCFCRGWLWATETGKGSRRLGALLYTQETLVPVFRARSVFLTFKSLGAKRRIYRNIHPYFFCDFV